MPKNGNVDGVAMKLAHLSKNYKSSVRYVKHTSVKLVSGRREDTPSVPLLFIQNGDRSRPTLFP